MNLWRRWLRRPQSVWLRRALFQVHLWTGIGLAVYIFVVCLSGSAAVFNSELYTAFLPRPRIVAIVGPRLTGDELKAAAQQAYPDSRITRIFEGRNPNEAARVFIDRGGDRDRRFFDPYTGRDLGTALPTALQVIGWISQLHMDLLMGYRGRYLNGAGGFLVALLSLTGLVIWWPGIQSWRNSLTIRREANLKRLNWHLHSAIGFWTVTFVFMWAITGAYLVFPPPFDKSVDFLASIFGRRVLLDQIPHSLHVGDFGGWPLKALYVILGLAPPALCVTGFLIWWNRVLNPWIKRGAGVPSAVNEAVAGVEEQAVPADGISGQ